MEKRLEKIEENGKRGRGRPRKDEKVVPKRMKRERCQNCEDEVFAPYYAKIPEFGMLCGKCTKYYVCDFCGRIGPEKVLGEFFSYKNACIECLRKAIRDSEKPRFNLRVTCCRCYMDVTLRSMHIIKGHYVCRLHYTEEIIRMKNVYKKWEEHN